MPACILITSLAGRTIKTEKNNEEKRKTDKQEATTRHLLMDKNKDYYYQPTTNDKQHIQMTMSQKFSLKQSLIFQISTNVFLR